MSLTERHPSFLERLPDWGLMHDSYAGERTVKAAGDRYLPPTAGMVANGYGKVTPVGVANLGQAAYDAYRKRALYPDAVKKTITGLLGMVHRKPPVIEVPAALQPMVDRATIAGETIEVLWRRITEAQLLDGRCGLLVDIPSGRSIGEVVPYIALYAAPAMPNWDAGIRAQGRALAGPPHDRAVALGGGAGNDVLRVDDGGGGCGGGHASKTLHGACPRPPHALSDR
jgi:hypothetical protein